MIAQLLTLMKCYGIRHVVVCPGSRNAPIVHAFASRSDCFCVHSVTDERSAGFVAIGMADALQQPVAVCVTSGSAVLNVAPAVSEAYYRRVPLLVISADRPAQWIGQMDGQTLPQHGCFGTLARSYQLPNDGSDANWWRNRLINEALNALRCCRPVHINVPLAEPLFNFPSSDSYINDAERVVKFQRNDNVLLTEEAKNEWVNARRRMIVVGQHYPSERLNTLLRAIKQSRLAVVMAETLSNLQYASVSNCYATYTTDDTPDFVLYLGGHIIMKQLKKYLRTSCVANIWRVENSDETTFIDTFQHTTRVLYTNDDCSIVSQLLDLQSKESESHFVDNWTRRVPQEIETEVQNVDAEYVAKYALKQLANRAEHSAVVLANSSTVRYAQSVCADYVSKCTVLCNRGVNGIEGSLSAAVGYAMLKKDELVLCIIGDLSFFYDHNALWNNDLPSNLRVLLLNDGGGKIFSHLPGLEQSPYRDSLISAQHNYQSEGWANDCNIKYYKSDSDAHKCKQAVDLLLNSNSDRPVLLEVVL
ncbi:MAG: 2-succinyl-5-enolpyruvyl-6-hydroxy-3-cyclohexene-1-carboxylic-acid synthase [Marinilabiliaceae bacterium]|nr:2-succinyl-5-enolpyruvyl-6-hydroxy-3-cyclohexene-1-carboxylic-acid synthase [Marinilabiliaceae bacterium]